VAGSCEHGNKPSGSIKGGEFLDFLSDCQLPKKDSVPWSWLLKHFDRNYLLLYHRKLFNSESRCEAVSLFLYRNASRDTFTLLFITCHYKLFLLHSRYFLKYKCSVHIVRRVLT
jgi:hypothetical protein